MDISPVLNIHGTLYSFERPRIMGIINVTPDSFFAGSRTYDNPSLEARLAAMVEAGTDIIDVGGYSTRPGAAEVGEDEEFDRLARALEILRSRWQGLVISVDTFRAGVAERCIKEFNIDIINDVAGGTLDRRIWEVAAETRTPYVLMHMRGTPQTMQSLTDYEDVTRDVILDLQRKADELHGMGVADVIIDPGFGFAKTVGQNFRLLVELGEFKKMGMPLLVGVSRKSMIWRALGITPAESLNGTTVLNTMALERGADILRVHDVREAQEARRLVELTLNNS